jgi:hypothetical protein
LAAFVEFTVEQGADFNTTINVKDEYGVATNLNDYTAAAQLRKSYYSTTAIDFSVTITDESSGEIRVALSSAVTANIIPGRYVYDLLIVSPTNVKTRVIEGVVNVLPSVTR